MSLASTPLCFLQREMVCCFDHWASNILCTFSIQVPTDSDVFSIFHVLTSSMPMNFSSARFCMLIGAPCLQWVAEIGLIAYHLLRHWEINKSFNFDRYEVFPFDIMDDRGRALFDTLQRLVHHVRQPEQSRISQKTKSIYSEDKI